MKNRMLHRIVALGAGLLCSLAVATTARAELVSYNFTASVNYVSGYLSGQGIGKTVSGSLSYDSDISFRLFGRENSFSLLDSSMNLRLDQLPTVGLTTLEYNGRKLTIEETGLTTGLRLYEATLVLTGQTRTADSLPSSLALGGKAQGNLTLDIIGIGGSPDLKATLTTLTRSGSGASTPELDSRSGAGALALLLGGLGIVLGRRRRA